MPTTLYLSFANLTCRFGDQFTLLDLAKEVVLPALFDPNHKRKFGVTNFIIRDTGATLVAAEGAKEEQVVVYGRLIKNTLLSRTQTYSEEEGLKPDAAILPSSPSSFFALNLNDHKLAFMPETPYAPTLSQFASTMQSFAREEHDRYVRSLYEAAKSSEQARTLTSLYAEYPAPDVKATPLSGDEDIEAFVASFAKITRLEFDLLSTNAEFNRLENFRTIRAMKDGVGSETTKLIHENSDGLIKSAVTDEVKEAAAGGNQRVKFTGLGEDGAKFSGSNEDFKLQVAFPDPPLNLARRAAEAIRTYFSQVSQGRLRPDLGRPNQDALESVKEGLRGQIERS